MIVESEQVGLIIKALDFAAHKHLDQRRKGEEAAPYINHPIALANLLWNVASVQDPVVVTAALLHDTVEDTDTTFQELAAEFGQEVENLVKEVTDDKSLPKPKRKQMQVEHAAHLSQKAKLIKLADKISNLRDMIVHPPADWSKERQLEYFHWGKQVIDRLRGSHTELEKIFDQVYQQGIKELAD